MTWLFRHSKFSSAGEPDISTPASTLPLTPVFAREHRAFADVHVPGDADLSAHHHIVLDDGTAGDADLRGQQNAAADLDAVGDVDEIVDFRALADPRFADRRSIDRRVRADLDVVFDDDVGELRNLQMLSVRIFREPEPVAADDGAVEHDNAIAELHALANRYVSMEDAVVADNRAGTDYRVRIDDRPGANSGAFADHGKRSNRCVGTYGRVWPRRRSGGRSLAPAATERRRSGALART